MSENVESFVAREKAFSDMNSELRYPQAQHVRIRRKIMEIAFTYIRAHLLFFTRSKLQCFSRCRLNANSMKHFVPFDDAP